MTDPSIVGLTILLMRFFATEPAFDLLFPRYGGFYVRCPFVVGEPGEVVFACKTGRGFCLVFVHSLFEVVGYADVECFGPVSQYVDVVLPVLEYGHGGEVLRCAQNDRGGAQNDRGGCSKGLRVVGGRGVVVGTGRRCVDGREVLRCAQNDRITRSE